MTKHLTRVSNVRQVPAAAYDPADVAKYLTQIINIVSAGITAAASWFALQEQKTGTGS